MKPLQPGDRCSKLSDTGSGLRLRYVVADDYLPLGKNRSEPLLVPVMRAINRRPRTRAEGGNPPVVTWIDRRVLRKLPAR